MADGAKVQIQMTGKTVTKANLLAMVAGLGLPIGAEEIHRITLGRDEIVVETPMRRSASGFFEARIITIPVVG